MDLKSKNFQYFDLFVIFNKKTFSESSSCNIRLTKFLIIFKKGQDFLNVPKNTDTSCKKGWYKCKLNGNAIPSKFICNGINECPLQDDEEGCENGKKRKINKNILIYIIIFYLKLNF